MIRNYFILIVIALSLIVTSCVSKKKFVEMQNGRLQAEDMVKQLTEENNTRARRIEALIADFEIMKNELLESNAIKDQYIDSLNARIFVLNENLDQKSQSLQETSFNLDFEKERLTNALKSKDGSIKSLQSSFNLDFEKQRLTQALESRNRIIKELESQVDQLESDITNSSSLLDQKNYDLNLLQDKVKMLISQNESSDGKINDLQAKLDQAVEETNNLNNQLKEKDAIITRLENNVKLLKGQIGGNQ